MKWFCAFILTVSSLNVFAREPRSLKDFSQEVHSTIEANEVYSPKVYGRGPASVSPEEEGAGSTAVKDMHNRDVNVQKGDTEYRPHLRSW